MLIGRRDAVGCVPPIRDESAVIIRQRIGLEQLLEALRRKSRLAGAVRPWELVLAPVDLQAPSGDWA
jgi:hypothetical protein